MPYNVHEIRHAGPSDPLALDSFRYYHPPYEPVSMEHEKSFQREQDSTQPLLGDTVDAFIKS